MSLCLKTQQLLGSGKGTFKELSPPIPLARANFGWCAGLQRGMFGPKSVSLINISWFRS